MRRVLDTTPKTGMAIINDVGEAKTIHPKNKKAPGERLALWALAKDYGKSLTYSGPLFKTSQVKDGAIRVTFAQAGDGLKVRDGGPLKRFEIAGADKVWHWAEAKIDGKDSVLVSSPQVKQPAAVRYAWAANPEGANLINSEGLPASVFRTDDWDDVEPKLDPVAAKAAEERRALGDEIREISAKRAHFELVGRGNDRDRTRLIHTEDPPARGHRRGEELARHALGPHDLAARQFHAGDDALVVPEKGAVAHDDGRWNVRRAFLHAPRFVHRARGRARAQHHHVLVAARKAAIRKHRSPATKGEAMARSCFWPKTAFVQSCRPVGEFDTGHAEAPARDDDLRRAARGLVDAGRGIVRVIFRARKFPADLARGRIEGKEGAVALLVVRKNHQSIVDDRRTAVAVVAFHRPEIGLPGRAAVVLKRRHGEFLGRAPRKINALRRPRPGCSRRRY